MAKYWAWAKKNWAGLTLTLIFIGAFWVRTYHFQQWLYFKMDQSRDALLINNILEKGPGYLPLLGARAGAVKLEHGFLRLGPIFYYFQYLSAKLFNSNDPAVIAYPDLFFSLAVIPLLYAFLRLYFSKWHSILVAAMYSFSFLIIQYSRFAWNPNSLQFFIILSFYGLLRFLNEQRYNRQKMWLALWVIGLTVGSQLHFFGFFSLLGISGLMILVHFRIWQKEKIRNCFKKTVLKKIGMFAAIGIGVFLIFYTPVIISEFKTRGQNSKNFIEALSAKPEKKPLKQKIVKDISENAKYYCLLTTSGCYGDETKNNILPLAVTGLVLLLGFILVGHGIRKEKKVLRQDFLILLVLWTVVFLILTIPVSFQLRPRFYIVVFATPFILLGLIYEYLENRFGKKAMFASALVTLGILGANFYGTAKWFSEQAKSQTSSFKIKRTLILKNKDGVTLGQLKRATDWIYDHHQAGKNLYYYIKPEHVRPINFLLVQKDDDQLNFASLSINKDPNGEFFAITPAKRGIVPFQKKFKTEVQILDQEQVGQLMVYKIVFPGRQTLQAFKFKKDSEGEDRFYWKDIFANTSTNKQ